MSLFRSAKWGQNFRRFILFCLVGGSGVFVDMTVLFLLTDARILGWGLLKSKALAAEAAIINNFVWNNAWTFRDISASQTGWNVCFSRFGKFNLICLAGIVLNLFLLKAQVAFFQMNIYLANFVGIFVASVWNFWMNLKFGWSTSDLKRSNG